MEVITLLSYQRSGSGWLSNLFDTKNSISLHEIFSKDPTLFIFNFYKTYKNISKSKLILDTLLKIYHPNNLFVDNINYKIIKETILSKYPYSFNLLKEFIAINHEQNKHVQFKIFPEHINHNISFEKIDEISTYLILNYRNNVLNTFISNKLAIKSGVWFSKQGERNEYNTKIIWREDEYLKFYKDLQKKFLTLERFFNQSSKPKILISYEEIHSQENKLEYVKSKFNSIGLNMIQFVEKQNYLKQNKIPESNIRENFLNPKDFDISFEKNLPINLI